MWIVLVGFLASVFVGFGRDESDGRVVQPLFVAMLVGLDGAFTCDWRHLMISSRRLGFSVGHSEAIVKMMILGDITGPTND